MNTMLGDRESADPSDLVNVSDLLSGFRRQCCNMRVRRTSSSGVRVLGRGRRRQTADVVRREDNELTVLA